MKAKDFILKEIIDKVGEYVADSNWAACLANLDAKDRKSVGRERVC